MSALVKDILIGLAFFLVIEGLIYALAPRLVREFARLLPSVPEDRLRLFGLAGVVLGVALVWLVRAAHG